MQDNRPEAKITTVGELVRTLSLLIEDDQEVARTFKQLADAGTVRSARQDSSSQIRVM